MAAERDRREDGAANEHHEAEPDAQGIFVRRSFTTERVSAGTVTHLHPSEVGMLHDHGHDPAHDEAPSVPTPWPPLSGPGSDKEAWVAFAREVAKGNEEAWEVVDEQAARVASLEVELAQLQARLTEIEPSERKIAEHQPATPKPRGSPRKTSGATREAIRTDLAAGLSQSQAAARNGVSAMTVSRLVRGV